MKRPHTVIVQLDLTEHGIDIDALLTTLEGLPNVVRAQDIATFEHDVSASRRDVAVRLPAADSYTTGTPAASARRRSAR